VGPQVMMWETSYRKQSTKSTLAPLTCISLPSLTWRIRIRGSTWTAFCLPPSRIWPCMPLTTWPVQHFCVPVDISNVFWGDTSTRHGAYKLCSKWFLGVFPWPACLMVQPYNLQLQETFIIMWSQVTQPTVQGHDDIRLCVGSADDVQGLLQMHHIGEGRAGKCLGSCMEDE
jgi:hypothetical protein